MQEDPVSTAEQPGTDADPADPGGRKAREPGFWYAACSLLVVVAILLVGMLVFGADIQLLLFFSMVALVPFVMRLGHDFEQTQGFAFDAIRRALGLIMILVAVGALIGAWAVSGTIAALVHAGLAVISPMFFLPTVLLLCMLTSLATGTSWGTIGTVGVAMVGVGAGLDYPAGMTAGAIVSGAYFGDKLSPFSDSTNLSPALVGTELITHIRHLLWTTVPAILFTGGIFTALGLAVKHGGGAAGRGQEISTTLAEQFHVGLPAFLPIVVVLVLLVLRTPAFPSILLGAFAGVAVAVPYQGESIRSTLAVLYQGFQADTGIRLVDDLLTGGGIESMLPVVALFMFAIGMAGMLSGSGMLLALIRPVLGWMTTQRRLLVSSVLLIPVLVALGGSFSFSAVLGGSLLLPLYHRFGLDPKNLSRVLEDSGTVNDPVFPWSSGGVFVAGALGVGTLDYLPFYFFGFLSVLMSLLLAVTGWKVPHVQR